MKTADEITAEIEATERTIENLYQAYNKGDIPRQVLSNGLREANATMAALKWVLGENDRYD